MNKRLLKRALGQQYRKRALIISVIVHVIVCLSSAFFFVKAVVQEAEDEIQVELISELPRQQVVKKTVPIPKKEEPPPKPKAEMPIPKEIPIEKKKITLEKTVDAIHPEHKLEIAKMPAKVPEKVELQSAAVKRWM